MMVGEEGVGGGSEDRLEDAEFTRWLYIGL